MKITARFPGRCAACGGAIAKGEEIEYDSEAKTAQHPGCVRDEPPDARAEALATELGFLPFADAMCCEWTQVRTCRSVLDLLSATSGSTTWRQQSDPRRGPDALLWIEET